MCKDVCKGAYADTCMDEYMWTQSLDAHVLEGAIALHVCVHTLVLASCMHACSCARTLADLRPESTGVRAKWWWHEFECWQGLMARLEGQDMLYWNVDLIGGWKPDLTDVEL